MSKVRNLPEALTADFNDLLYIVDSTVGANGGKKIKISTLRTAIEITAAEVKTKYESNADTNAFTDAEKSKLGTIEIGAAFQNAAEVPYDNSVSGLSATEVQSAIDELSATADFRPSIVSGRILHYTGGTARFDDTFFELTGNDILLNSSITNGTVYLDLDGIVKQTGSGILPPPYTIVIAKFSTDLNDIISLQDQRVKNSQNIVRGLVGDVRDVRAGAVASAGSSGRVSDAMHKHDVLTAAPSTILLNTPNSEGTSIELARAGHGHLLETDIAIDIATANGAGSGNKVSASNHTHKGTRSFKANLGTERFGDLSLIDSVSTTASDNGSGGFSIDTKFGANEFVITSTSGLTINYSGGRFVNGQNGTVNNIPAGGIAVTANTVLGYLYVAINNLTGTGTVTAATTPPTLDSIPFAQFTSGPSTIISTTDIRSFVNQVPVANTLRAGYSGTGLTVTYNSGAVRFNGTLTGVPAGSIVLSDGVATGAIYVDPTTALVTANGTGIFPPNSVPMATYTTAGGAVTALSLARVFINNNLTFGLVGDITTVSNTAKAAGTTNKYADAGHQHDILIGTPVTQTPDQANSNGSGTAIALANHVHNIPTASAVSISTSTANTQGALAFFSNAGHTHAVSITNQVVTATADDTTTSVTDVLIVGMTTTPAAGTYLVSFSSSGLNSANGASRMFVSIYSGGSQVTDSERNIGVSGGANSMLQTNAIVTVNGSQAIETRWRAVAGTNTVHQRSMTLLKLS